MRLAKVPGLNFGLSFTETFDGGMIGTGQDDGAGGHGICDLYVHKIDECGVTEWYKRFGGGYEDGGKYITQLADGGYAVGGLCASSGAGAYDLWLMKLDVNGNLLWSKTFGNAGDDMGRCVAQAPNGDIVFSGYISGNFPVIFRTDINGNIIWQKQFQLAGGICNYVEFFSNGDLLALGDFVGPYGGRDVFAARLNGSGNLIWAQQFGTATEDGIDWDVAGKIGANDFVVSATMDGFGTGQDMTVSKFDGNGNLQWNKRLWGAGVDKAHFVNQTSDGGYIQSGTTNSWGFGDYDVLVNRLDPNGNHLWTKLYGGPGIDKGWGVQETSDNGYLLSTLTTSFGALYYDPMFIKTDGNGDLVDCPNVQTPPVNFTDANYSISPVTFAISDVNYYSGNYMPTGIDNTPVEENVCFSCINEPQFEISDSIVCQGDPLYLINQTSVGLLCSQEWFIQDTMGGSVSALPGADTAVYTFNTPGFFYIVLNADCGGITNADTLTIIVLPKPVVDFAMPDVCLNEQPVAFIDNSSFNPNQWSWDFGDGNVGSGSTVNHVYTDSGTYNVQLIVTNVFSCSDTLEQIHRVYDKPTANFSFNDTCFGGPNNFVDLSQANDGLITNFDWNFGDLGTSIQQNPSYTYSAFGTFPVQLIVTTDNGCKDTLVQDVASYALPHADFTFPSNCINDPISIQDASTQGDWNVVQWNWAIDTVAVNGPSIQYTFPNDGIYPVQLFVLDAFGCVDSISQQVVVSVRPDLTLFVNNDCELEQFEFSNSSTIAFGTIDSVNWNMGDGSSYSSLSPNHVYTNFGIYNVTFYAESNIGCGSDTTFQVEVYPNPIAGLVFADVCEGETMYFNEITTVPIPGQLLMSDWDIGDGTSFIDTSITSHNYLGFGNYTVQLSAETQHGCTDVANYDVEVYPLPISNFSVTNICNDVPEVFVNLSSGGSISRWDFGDGTTSLDDQPLPHVYTTFGTYIVELIIETGSGCSDTLAQQLEVFAVPVADFTFDTVCFPLPTTFADLSTILGTDQIANWDWRFGDAGFDATQNPLHNYAQWGDYTVTLTVTSENGCVDDTIIGPARVHPKPQAIFDDAITNCHQDTTTFQDLSTIANAPLDSLALWTWNFGDGTTSTMPDPFHVYANEGMFDAMLAVMTNHGCVDTVFHQVEIYPLPRVAFSADTTHGCQPFRAQFLDETTIPSPYNLSRWEWNFGDSSELVSAQFPVHTYLTDTIGPLEEGVFTVTLTVASGNGCISSATYPNYMTEYPRPDAWFDVDPKRAELLFARMQVADLSSINVSNWNYDFGDGSTAIAQNPQHSYRDTGTYIITQYVATQYGCLDTAEFTVIVDPEFYFYIPNTFTPNNEGHNETFFGTGVGVIGYAMVIFDRWGSQVFESGAMDLHWDGKKNGHPVQQGVYTYMFKIIDVKGNPHEYVGHVNLMR
jgi:gliding motility-associated-like protein